ncbi:MAG: tryptophan--tRNA ligase, partial [Candidatus Marinimicrobia bacterium]|nr:tryptophan--tRNA ligase [Candidatus Neomarinimicrobiota bacterium]
MQKKVSLTGIKPTGIPHIGNYFGAIRPALELSKEYEARYFIADYHALNSVKDPHLLKEMVYEVAATWLASGLDPEKVLFYRQSDVPETFDLAMILMAFTPKGLMNRAHAYKSAVQENEQAGKDPDDGINMGLYTYPVLMAADILLFDTNVVPVGKDQKQHVEMAADIAQSLNRTVGKNLLVIPEAKISESTQTVVGLDGRKMSKSYNNTISLFLPSKKLHKTLMKIVTNSQGVEEPKDPETSHIFTLYKLFATPEQQKKLAQRYRAGGMGWGEAKQELFEVMDTYLAPMREKYYAIIDDKEHIDKILKEGAE